MTEFFQVLEIPENNKTSSKLWTVSYDLTYLKVFLLKLRFYLRIVLFNYKNIM